MGWKRTLAHLTATMGGGGVPNPGQVKMIQHISGGRWRGDRDGDTCTSMADSCQGMVKNHYNVVISLQLI